VSKVKISERIIQYILDIARFSRQNRAFKYGLTTRCLIALKKASQAWAFIDGRDFVSPDDVKAVFTPVTFHRLSTPSDIQEKDHNAFLNNFLNKVTVPL
jgi:MoxR-like ATPase